MVVICKRYRISNTETAFFFGNLLRSNQLMRHIGMPKDVASQPLETWLRTTGAIVQYVFEGMHKFMLEHPHRRLQTIMAYHAVHPDIPQGILKRLENKYVDKTITKSWDSRHLSVFPPALVISCDNRKRTLPSWFPVKKLWKDAVSYRVNSSSTSDTAIAV
ncbi:MAG: hypothetical protein ACP5FL_08315 [Thermoplasmatota archaeon]